MMTNLDARDRKLLLAIDFHARDSYAHLAKAVGSSKQAVDYKLKRLQKLGVIKGYYALVDTTLLGYFYCRLLVTLQGASDEVINEITKELLKEKRVLWLLTTQGQYDLLIDLWTLGLDEFRVFAEDFMSRFGKYVKRKSENIITNTIHFQNRYLTRQSSTEEFRLKQSDKRVQIDDIDRKLLSELCKDARIHVVKLAKVVKLSSVAVARRIRNLEREGVIAGYRPNIDHNKLGFGYYKILLNLSIPSRENLHAVKEYIKHQPLSLYIVEGVGIPGDLDFEIVAQSPFQIDELIRKLRSTFPGLISDYAALLYTSVLKVSYLPF